MVPRSFHETAHSDAITALISGKWSRLGESNPRPTHYERRDHRVHHALRVHPSVHVRAFTVHNNEAGRTSFQATNQATTEINELRRGVVARPDQHRPRASSRALRTLNLRIRGA